jgi:hypothetical protein
VSSCFTGLGCEAARTVSTALTTACWLGFRVDCTTGSSTQLNLVRCRSDRFLTRHCLVKAGADSGGSFNVAERLWLASVAGADKGQSHLFVVRPER